MIGDANLELRWCVAALTATAPLTTGLDEGRLLPLLRHHRLLLRLPSAALARVSPATADLIKQARRHAFARTMAGRASLFRVIQSLEHHNIPTLCLKGPALAGVFGAADRLRMSHDFDLLVRPAHLPQAEAILRQLGYQPDLADRQTSPWHGHSWSAPAHSGIIELHHRLCSPPSLLPSSLFDPWRHTQPVTIQGGRLTTLTAPASLVYLAVHGTQHVWWRLFWLVDIADAMVDPAVDWQQALALARSARVEHYLLLALGLAQQILAAPLPASLADRQADIATLIPTMALVARGLTLTPLPERQWVYRLGLASYVGWHWRLAPSFQARRDMLKQILWPAGLNLWAALRRWVRIAKRTQTGGPMTP